MNIYVRKKFVISAAQRNYMAAKYISSCVGQHLMPSSRAHSHSLQIYAHTRQLTAPGEAGLKLNNDVKVCK